MFITVVNDLKGLTRGKTYQVHNHIYCTDFKSIVDDSGYYRKVYKKDFE